MTSVEGLRAAADIALGGRDDLSAAATDWLRRNVLDGLLLAVADAHRRLDDMQAEVSALTTENAALRREAGALRSDLVGTLDALSEAHASLDRWPVQPAHIDAALAALTRGSK